MRLMLVGLHIVVPVIIIIYYLGFFTIAVAACRGMTSGMKNTRWILARSA